MLGLLNWGKKPTESTRDETSTVLAPSAAPARGSGQASEIRYYAGLIDKLKRDHEALLGAFGQVQSAFASGDVTTAASRLSGFRVAINSHLMMEGVRLYAYLERELAQDPASHDVVQQFRKEMDGIGQAVIGFLAKYADLGRNEALEDSFGRDLEAVGKVLSQRIQREEALLYPLYARSQRV
ncbi:hypothetical protein BURK2_03487 [Burkholderiales bacterium]|nr:MAG: hemerythrin domain-containing protein [Burkholderiales bacterium]CAG1006464.1 hypothetical protein BURK2_03487 [Burkholderiales bacterium]